MALLPFGSAPTPNASASRLGKIMLAGDLGGTAAAPTVQKIQGVAISGTPSAGQAIIASSPTAAAWGDIVAAKQRTFAYWARG